VSDLAIKNWTVKTLQEKISALRDYRAKLVQDNAKECHIKVCDREILMAANALLFLNSLFKSKKPNNSSANNGSGNT